VSTFLELCANLARESGAVGSAPASVVNQTGRQGKCVEWVRQAWTQIQADNPDWSFLRQEFSGTLSVDVMEYAPGSFAITSFARWIPDVSGYQPMTIYPAGQQEQECTLRQLDYVSWRTSYNRGVHDAAKPVRWAIHPDGSFLVGPKPDQGYIVRGEYQRGPQNLVADGDIPIMPAQYHDAIVWRAAMMLAEHDEAPVAHQGAQLKYSAILTSMVRDLLPAVELGGNALA
jgi:hypothetical protein